MYIWLYFIFSQFIISLLYDYIFFYFFIFFLNKSFALEY